MKYSLLFFLLLAFTAISAQDDCANGRYRQELFPAVTPTLDIPFGENLQPTVLNPNARQTLYLDVYEPAGDTLAQRPLIVLAFGGSFVFGDRKSPDIVELCRRFARLGYVTVSIDYRLTTGLIFNGSEELLYQAVLKAVHDMKAAIRFFYKDASTLNQFRIDSTRIFAGGVSAGAVGALHMAYLDDLSEIPPALAVDTAGLGGLEGLSGNPGYSSRVAGILNLCGALGNPAWIEPGDLPLVSLHGTADEIVPVNADTLTLFGINTLVYGSEALHARCDSLGNVNRLYLYQGAGHVPFVDLTGVIPEYMDTTFRVLRDFLAEQLCGPATPLETLAASPALRVYPNPFATETRIDLGDLEASRTRIFVGDLMGRAAPVQFRAEGKNWILDRGSCSPGQYFVRISDLKGDWQQVVKIRIQ